MGGHGAGDETERTATTNSDVQHETRETRAAGGRDARAGSQAGIAPSSGIMAEMDPFQVDELFRLGIIPADDQPPFDIIGDVHGCIAELRQLLALLGYQRRGEAYAHPQGRRLVFAGDLEDRGPDSVAVLRAVIASHKAGSALLVLGNHDNKFLRWLRGRNVRIGNGLEQTIRQLDAVPAPQRASLRRATEELFGHAPGYLLLDGGQLVVTHGAILDSMIGHWNDRIASFCLFADVIGRTASGKPIRADWGAARDVAAAGGARAPRIVYGHNPVPQLAWVNRTLDLDTGVVYGGALSALRYPELETVQVPSQQAYSTHKHI
ncbi:MAG: metallophosphoesterase [Ktedonobacterales bacterium]